jgi:hypothetical protein
VENNIDNILKKADSENLFSRPVKRVFEFSITFSSFKELSLFFGFIYDLKLDVFTSFESLIKGTGTYDVIITNKDNLNYEKVKRTIELLIENKIKVH